MQNMGWNRGMPSNMLKEFKQSLKSSFKTKKTNLMNTADNEIMNKKPIFAFNKNVTGSFHILKNRPMEDFSASFSEETGKYYIAVVADGHGSAECFRSSFGSKTAVEVTMEALKLFAEAIKDTLSESEVNVEPTVAALPEPAKEPVSFTKENKVEIEKMIHPLTGSIISEWNDQVEADYENNPPTDEELQKAGLSEKPKDNIPHVYGTTLMAALWLPEYLIIIHQGDGRCVVFYDDGTVDQPVPWDDRCIGTAVTSMCDADAADRIRHYVLNFKEKKAIACFLGSDGVEDAYRDTYDEKRPYCMGDMGGVYTFYKNLTCEIIENGRHQFETYLDKMLPVFSAEGLFSRTGSGDDVSVAGIVNVEDIKKYYKQFKLDIQVYDLKERLFWKEDELRGKTRKHGILLKRMNDANTEISKAQETVAKIENEIDTWLVKQSESESDIQKAKIEIQEFEQAYTESETELNNGTFDKVLRTLGMNKLTANHKREKARNSLQVQYNEKIEKLNKCTEKLEKLRLENDSAVDLLHQVEVKFADAKQKFEEYDESYRRIENECKQLQTEIDKVLSH